MALTEPEVRVLAALIEKEAAVPESYPLTLNALRLACNQATNRRPVVSYDDRTVEAALLSLKSVGLIRFVHPSHGGRTTRYRHTADERWRLSPRRTARAVGARAARAPDRRRDPRPDRSAAPGRRVVDDRGAARCPRGAQSRAAGGAARSTTRRARRPLGRGDRCGGAVETETDSDEVIDVDDDAVDDHRPTRLRRTGVARRLVAEASRRAGGDGRRTAARLQRLEQLAGAAGLD